MSRLMIQWFPLLLCPGQRQSALSRKMHDLCSTNAFEGHDKCQAGRMLGAMISRLLKATSKGSRLALLTIDSLRQPVNV